MRIIAHVTKFYDWKPVPENTEVTEADIAAARVKPDANGGWLMRITVSMPSSTQILIGEGDIAAVIFQAKMKDGEFLNRAQAAKKRIAVDTAKHHFHRAWISGFQVEDDGPMVEAFEQEFNRLLAAHLVQEEDRAEMLEAYAHPFTNAELSAFFMSAFNVTGGA